jgi:hypothetical protein
MSKPDSYPTAEQNQMHARNNPEHPSWKLPPGQAYVATREERMSRYKRAAEKTEATTATPSAAPPTTGSNYHTPAARKPVAPVPEPKSKQEIKADAAAAVTAAYKRHGSGFRIRVQPPEQWECEAKALSAREGCDFMEAMYRAGFVHAAVSFPPVGGRG